MKFDDFFKGENFDEFFKKLTPEQRQRLKFDWLSHARPEQIQPLDPWSIWLIQTGRGWGKTRTGAETIRIWSRTEERTMIVGPTAGDVRKILIDGPSGVLACCPDDERPTVNYNTETLTWPNGHITYFKGADDPERLRGYNISKAWLDEVGSWRYPESFDNIVFCLRESLNPQMIITSTPRNTPLFRKILALRAIETVVLTRGATRDNRANLSKMFLKAIEARYTGMRLGRQEIEGEFLEADDGALWNRTVIDETRVLRAPDEFEELAIGLDPAMTCGEDSDESGIVTCGRTSDGHFYVLEDSSARLPVDDWARRALASSRYYNNCLIIGEKNQGGDTILSVLQKFKDDVASHYRGVSATQGKLVRASTVAPLYNQRLVHHVGTFGELEDQMCNYSGSGASPDRLDALVHALMYLSGQSLGATGATDYFLEGLAHEELTGEAQRKFFAPGGWGARFRAASVAAQQKLANVFKPKPTPPPPQVDPPAPTSAAVSVIRQVEGGMRANAATTCDDKCPTCNVVVRATIIAGGWLRGQNCGHRWPMSGYERIVNYGGDRRGR